VNSIYLAGADIPNSVDWFGVNHYFTMKVHFPTYDYMGTHNSLGEALYELSRRYGDIPFHITEHGTNDGSIHDEKRSKYIVNSLAGLQNAITAGAQVHSYEYWSLLDNFEWDHGFYPKYGLFEVNFTSLERIPRDFAELYANISRAHMERHGRSSD